MKIIKIWGGLGNQLFQYMLYRRLRNEYGNVYVDLSWFDNTNRKFYYPYQLEKLGLSVDVLDLNSEYYHSDLQLEFLRLSANNKLLIKKVFKVCYWISRCGKLKLSIINENGLYKYDASIIQNSNDTYIVGFWQNLEYYKNILLSVIKEMKFDSDIKKGLGELIDIINDSNSVSIHIRRNDYDFEDFNDVCSDNYYLKSISYIEGKIDTPIFLVFSNRIDIAKKMLGEKKKFIYVDVNDRMNGLGDLYLMSICKHHILSNSTFSWWGAALDKKLGNNITILPQKWHEKEETLNLLYDGWLEL